MKERFTLYLQPREVNSLPSWEGVGEVVVYDPLTADMKRVVADALKNKVPVRGANPQSLQSLDSFVTGNNQ